MSSLIFKFCLPALLGYTLFVALSGRFNPFSKPTELERRPSWLLGSWIGFSVAIVTGVVLHVAYKLPLDAVKTLIQPTALLMASLVVPGLIAYLVYKHVVRAHFKTQEKVNMSAGAIMDAQIEQIDELDFDDTLAIDTSDDFLSFEPVVQEQSELTSGNADTPVTFDEVAGASSNESVSLLFDSVTPPAANEEQLALNEQPATNVPTVQQDTVTPVIVKTANQDSIELINKTDINTGAVATPETAAQESQSASVTTATEKTQPAAPAAPAKAAQKTQPVAVAKVAKDSQSTEAATTEVDKLKAEIDELKQSLNSESSLRSHTETHLRITRKALRNLEGDTRDFESDKADALINVEGQLDSRIKEVAAAQARANREESARIEAQTNIVNMKQDILEAKRELRRNTESRAKALSAANKTVAFARQSVQARTRAEARIKQLESRLKLSQETVSSLIAALDKEKARTQGDVTEMAKELILQQKRINEKRTLDEAGRRTPKRLTRRTAKKVS